MLSVAGAKARTDKTTECSPAVLTNLGCIGSRAPFEDFPEFFKILKDLDHFALTQTVFLTFQG